jgi:hypothetical protein
MFKRKLPRSLFSVLLERSSCEIDFKKEQRRVIRHEGKIRDIEMRLPDRVKIVVHVKEKESVSRSVGRQNIGAKGHGPQRCDHFLPGLALSRV